ncbi:restriction endonuclease subunit S [Thalassomonas actiniarum]|uniref:Restriction endonuclease subunit S n=2 Tax=Thalassomonas actiniarum TaxID=485447 RepID=A0AAF0C6A4_9GAMM|nr:restriction endonuclease subunit S [Thalassomonas actiniarum]
MGNLQEGKLDWSNLVYTSDKNEITKYSLKSGDVLFNRTNSPELVGKTAIYSGEKEAIYAGYLIKARCSELLLPEYLNYSLNSSYGKEYCRQVKSDGVSQSNINAQKLGAFVLPLPSVEEQSEIVHRVEELFTFANKVEAQINAAQTRVNNLTQSILTKAFSGELTKDWRAANPELISGDNSASALLEKIKLEREQQAAQKKKKKSAKKSTTKKASASTTQPKTTAKTLATDSHIIEKMLAEKTGLTAQNIFEQLANELSLTQVFTEIANLLAENKIEEQTINGITGFVLKQ